jgi:mannose-6-phosphate isomerase-like protein (cupin superfamily)
VSAEIIRRFAELITYAPPLHQDTVNRRIFEGCHTDGRLSFNHGTVEPGGGAAVHLHRRSDQLNFVIAGTCRMTVGDETVALGPGDAVLVPRGMQHGTEVTSDGPFETAVLYLPALDPDDTFTPRG